MADSRLNIVIIGDSGVGKSSLVTALKGEEFQASTKATIGVDGPFDVVDGYALWDAAGQDRFQLIVNGYLKSAHVVVIAYALTSKQSFDNVKKHLENARRIAPNACYYLVGTKADLEDQQQVTPEDLDKFFEVNGDVICAPSISAKSPKDANQDVKEAFDWIVRGVRVHYALQAQKAAPAASLVSQLAARPDFNPQGRHIESEPAHWQKYKWLYFAVIGGLLAAGGIAAAAYLAWPVLVTLGVIALVAKALGFSALAVTVVATVLTGLGLASIPFVSGLLNYLKGVGQEPAPIEMVTILPGADTRAMNVAMDADQVSAPAPAPQGHMPPPRPAAVHAEFPPELLYDPDHKGFADSLLDASTTDTNPAASLTGTVDGEKSMRGVYADILLAQSASTLDVMGGSTIGASGPQVEPADDESFESGEEDGEEKKLGKRW